MLCQRPAHREHSGLEAVSSQASQMRVPGAGRMMFPLINLERQREELVEVEG